jgi:hypothetical protein
MKYSAIPDDDYNEQSFFGFKAPSLKRRKSVKRES